MLEILMLLIVVFHQLAQIPDVWRIIDYIQGGHQQATNEKASCKDHDWLSDVQSRYVGGCQA